eukprot:gene7530-6495_t
MRWVLRGCYAVGAMRVLCGCNAVGAMWVQCDEC